MWNIGYQRNDVPALPENFSDIWLLCLSLQQPAPEIYAVVQEHKEAEGETIEKKNKSL